MTIANIHIAEHTCSSKSLISRDKLPDSFTSLWISEQSVCSEIKNLYIRLAASSDLAT